MGSSKHHEEAQKEEGGKKRSREESKSSGPPVKKPCPEVKHESTDAKHQRKRQRPDNSVDGPKKKTRKTGSQAGDMKHQEPRPGPSTESCPKREPTVNLNRFKLDETIGKGNFGSVIKVWDKVLRKILAVKIVLKGSSPADQKRIDIEHEILQLAAGSPFLIHCHLSFPTKTKWYFAMDFASGGDLQKHLRKHGRLPIASATFYAAEITCGLQFLHQKGFVHRDIKPANILIDTSGHIKIADFGLAIKKTEGIVGKAGTPFYIAPEVMQGHPYNTAADWFSFGVVLFQLTTGQNSSKCTISALPQYHLESSAEDILKELLTEDPERRLGLHGCIRAHPFFKEIDWTDLEELKIPPPFVPGQPSRPP